MPSQYSHIGEVIRARRDLLGLTQKDLCDRLGWLESRTSEISALENGRNTNISLKRLEAIAAALDCQASELVFMLNASLEAIAETERPLIVTGARSTEA